MTLTQLRTILAGSRHRALLVLGVSLVAAAWLVNPRPVAATTESGLVGAAARHQAVATRTTTIRLYYVALSDNGRSGVRIGCGDSLVPVTRTIPSTTAPLSAAMRLLVTDHRKNYGQSGLYNPLYQATLHFRRASIVSGKAWIYLTGRMNLRGVCDNPRVDGMLKYTARQFPTVRSVAVYVNGVPLSRLLSGKG